MANLHIRSDGVKHSVQTIDGEPIFGVSEIKITLLPCDVSVALVTINMVGIDIEAHPMLSVESLQEAATYHGFKLVPDEGEI